jgi:hypothetical protein
MSDDADTHLPQESLSELPRPANLVRSSMVLDDELKKAARLAAAWHDNEVARLQRSMALPFEQLQDRLRVRLEPLQASHLKISQMLEASLRPLEGVFKANEQWQRMADEAARSLSRIADMSEFHNSWQRAIQPLRFETEHLNAMRALSVNETALRISAAERLFAGIDFDAIQRALAVPVLDDKLLRSISDISSSFERFAVSLPTLPDISRMPDFVVPSASRELLLEGYALETLHGVEDFETLDVTVIEQVEIARGEVTEGLVLLEQVDRRLAKAYAGARAALNSDNPDRVRHVLVSLRELWGHLLRFLAPDPDVLVWVPDASFLHEGKPTRRARVLYICRFIDHPPLSDFLAEDTRALVKMIEFFNHVHDIEADLTLEQLEALILRTDSWLTYILRIWKEGR